MRGRDRCFLDFCLLVVLFCLSFCSEALGQVGSSNRYAERAYVDETFRRAAPQSELHFRELESWFRGDTLHLRFRLDVKGSIVGFDEALHLVPMYLCGDAILPFPEIQIQDATRHSYYQREMELLPREEYLDVRPYRVVIQEGRRTEEQVRYSWQLVLPEGVCRDGKLKIFHFLQDCCDLHELESPYEVPLSKVSPSDPVETVEVPLEVFPPVVYPEDLVFYRPAPEAVKDREAHGTFRIQFVVAQHDIRPGFARNYEELRKVDDFLRPLLESDPRDIELRGAEIRGYASPEASYEYNLALSQRRADSFKDYLRGRYTRLSSLLHFPSIGMGEDWEGLRQLIVESPLPIPMREEVLFIIDFVDLFQGRESRLMELGGGVPYKYLLEHLFPPLRRMEMELSYRVRSYSPEEVGVVYDRRPQDLSHEELYQVAQQRNDHRGRSGLHNFGLEYDLSAKYYPEDKLALLNASSAALVRSEWSLAGKYLERIKDEPEALINLGLYHWAVGDYGRAVDYLERAIREPRQSTSAKRYLQTLRRELKGPIK